MEDETRTIFSTLSRVDYMNEHLLYAINNDDNLINRRGAFKLDRDILSTQPHMAARILNACIVLRAEMMLAYDSIEYHALSPFFDVIEKGQLLPEYHFEIEVGNHNTLKEIRAKRM